MNVYALVSGSLILGIGYATFTASGGQTVANLGNVALPSAPNFLLNYQYNVSSNSIALRSTPLTQQQYQDASFYASATLAEAQTYACAALLANMNQFILYQPNGAIRYDQDFTNSVFIFLQVHAPNGLTTAPIPDLFTWENAVRTFYFTTEAAIMACTTVAEVQAIDVSVANFEAQFGASGSVSADPSITTQVLSS
jgi:hypothetical protein